MSRSSAASFQRSAPWYSTIRVVPSFNLQTKSGKKRPTAFCRKNDAPSRRTRLRTTPASQTTSPSATNVSLLACVSAGSGRLLQTTCFHRHYPGGVISRVNPCGRKMGKLKRHPKLSFEGVLEEKRKLLNNPWRMSPAAIAPSVKVGLSDCFEAQNGHLSMEPAKSRHRGG